MGSLPIHPVLCEHSALPMLCFVYALCFTCSPVCTVAMTQPISLALRCNLVRRSGHSIWRRYYRRTLVQALLLPPQAGGILVLALESLRSRRDFVADSASVRLGRLWPTQQLCLEQDQSSASTRAIKFSRVFVTGDLQNPCAGVVHARPIQESDTQRRLRESQRVDERITTIYNIDDLRQELIRV